MRGFKMFWHACSLHHLIPNVFVQLLIGFPAEVIHTPTSVALIYVCGSLSGSLAVHVLEHTVNLVGSSAGIYAIALAYIAHFILVDFVF